MHEDAFDEKQNYASFWFAYIFRINVVLLLSRVRHISAILWDGHTKV